MGCLPPGRNRFRPLVSGGNSIILNARAPLAVEYGLRHFHLLVANSTVAVCSDNSTSLAYLCKQGGTRFPILNSIAWRILRWAEMIELVLIPQFIQGKNNVLADSLSLPNQVKGSEWPLKWEVFRELNNKWPVRIDHFATSLNQRCSLYFSPLRDPSAIGTDALLQNWDGYQVYAFPPWSMIPLVLKKLPTDGLLPCCGGGACEVRRRTGQW